MLTLPHFITLDLGSIGYEHGGGRSSFRWIEPVFGFTFNFFGLSHASRFCARAGLVSDTVSKRRVWFIWGK